MSNYCTYDDVSVLTGTPYTATSNPTTTQITLIITLITNEIDLTLNQAGITSQPTDTNLLGVLKMYCMIGSAGMAGQTYFQNSENVEQSQSVYYWKQYKDFLSSILTNPEVVGVQVYSAPSISNQITDGVYSETELPDYIGNKFIY